QCGDVGRAWRERCVRAKYRGWGWSRRELFREARDVRCLLASPSVTVRVVPSTCRPPGARRRCRTPRPSRRAPEESPPTSAAGVHTQRGRNEATCVVIVR
ncbi:unnamed protein product, partial [Hapterophycus canaliculatus]